MAALATDEQTGRDGSCVSRGEVTKHEVGTDQQAERARRAAWQREYRKAYSERIAAQRRASRDRRRQERQRPQAGEIGAEAMARLISDRCGFHVPADYLLAAARAGKSSSRLAARGLRYFQPDAVLREIGEGEWRPRRKPRPKRRCRCSNPACTRGADGCRGERLVHRCVLDTLCAEGKMWTCCRACARALTAVRRPRSARIERRQCGSELDDGQQCSKRIAVTTHQMEAGTGPMRCAECAAAGRITVAQREARQRNARQAAQAAGWRASWATASEVGRRRMRSPSYVANLHQASMEDKAARRELLKRRIRDGLRADPNRPDLAIAREVGRSMGGRQCRVSSVKWLRAELEAVGEIAPRAFSAGVVVRHRDRCASRSGQPCDCAPAFRAWVYDPDRKRTVHRSFATSEAAERWCAETRMSRAATAPTTSPFLSSEYTEIQIRSWGANARRRAQRDGAVAAVAQEQADRAEGLHRAGASGPEIAEALSIAERTVKRYLDERGRSERSPGRREAKQRRRVVEHLERVGWSDERRGLQRATKMPAADLDARLAELNAEAFVVNGRACVRVSPKSATPTLTAA
jgi:hypothetical protein